MNERFAVGVFPGAANLAIELAKENGSFARVGVDVEFVGVTSSADQLQRWDVGALDAMVTSPDHLIRERRAVAPLIVRPAGMGELVVCARRGVDLGRLRWGVDDPGSAFALVLRAVVEDVAACRVDPAELILVGGTKERFDAMVADEPAIDGATLHAPFDAIVLARGAERIGGHGDVVPDLLCGCLVVPRDRAADELTRAFLATRDVAVARLLDLGPEGIGDLVGQRDAPRAVASAVGEALAGRFGLDAGRGALLAGVEAAIALRRRFEPGFEPAVPVAELLGADDV